MKLRITSALLSMARQSNLLTNSLYHNLLSLPIANNLHAGPESICVASADFSLIDREFSTAVLRPSCPESSIPFTISARRCGHSVWGQAMARDGVIMDMSSLGHKWPSTSVLWSRLLGHYANVGSQQLWIDVWEKKLKHNVAPVSRTDYLYLTVGGALFNASSRGETFRDDLQISNVYEMDVIAGTGDFLTYSTHENPNLLYSGLGGFGQFGIITRARIALDQAPKRQLMSLVTKHELLYCIEVARYYDKHTQSTVDKVQVKELKLRRQWLWNVSLLWINLFVPKSRIADFNLSVFKNIVLTKNIATGYIFIHPMNKISTWGDRMSAVTPYEDIFYTVEFLHSSEFGDCQEFDLQNKELLRYCEDNGIMVKQYLPDYSTKREWMQHFGPKWRTLQENKALFDPKMLLSPGQRIFNHN
ncbi:hypothetical protein BT93_L4544 [Corymbia citriodora subsp. variegata]|uniref:Cytokinin dehydrogenase 1 FAD/cytokinin binding domain-containing protein n=1 Tax=Corymbia citriodora subsp. variegata TaxID=360336 RepID=A0A8T0CU08_CORYI|nr:hypothetical protein BT93_L4544 [Corymbia citriodora subsp. variegata]